MADYFDDQYVDDYNSTNNTIINDLSKYNYEELHNHDNRHVVKVKFNIFIFF